MLLCVDIANEDINLGLFDGERLAAHWRLETQIGRTEDEYGVMLAALYRQAELETRETEAAIIASVVPPLLPVWQQVCRRLAGQPPLVVGAGIKTGLRIRREAPRQLGADRVANAVAAKTLFGGPICVVDFGTTTTFDALDAQGDYLGHAIAPGLGMAAQALAQGAMQLPSIPLARPDRVIGRNTVESMQAGLIFGYVGLVEGLVERFRGELGEGMGVVATGRHAPLIAQETRVIQRLEPWLTLHGLRLIAQMNA
ncbi:MAG: type III pantothenate kinase [Chloroflexi bacterium]|nr:MAG: type III pantothenate kinase [Chloroflexota bacterium]